MDTTIRKQQHHYYHHPPKHVSTPLGHMLSLIEVPTASNVRFLILDCPTESTLSLYVDEFIHYNVSTVVRCCQPTYSAQKLISRSISVIDLPFKDGGIPPENVIHEWIHIIQNASNTTIAVHCVAGLGRAPVLVAIALIELGMAPLDAIQFIREKRKGAFNKPQITFLDSYKKRKPAHQPYSFRTSFGRMFGFGPKTVSQQT